MDEQTRPGSEILTHGTFAKWTGGDPSRMQQVLDFYDDVLLEAFTAMTSAEGWMRLIDTCNCSRCIDSRAAQTGAFHFRRMVVCSTCGNKRCPHAADHRLACTGSNEPGQPGSNYPAHFGMGILGPLANPPSETP